MINVGNIYAGLGGGGGGGMVNTLDNGLTLTGANGQLGGVLIKNTVILGGNNSFEIDSVNGSFVSEAQFVVAGSQILLVTYDGTGLPMGFDIDGGSGVFSVIDQIFGVGMQKTGAITAANQLANPNAYITTDCLQAAGAVIISKTEDEGESASQLIFTFTVPASAVYRINIYITYRTGTGNVATIFDYTDVQGTFQIVNLPTIDSTTRDANISPIVFKANTASDIEVATTVTGTIIYDIAVVLEQLY